jgi:predicted Zn-dependent peptidase
MAPTRKTVTRNSTAGTLPSGGVRRSVLPGGIRVVTEHVPGVRSVAIGIFVGVGSRHETRRQAGASHYLEHVLFKGTPSRSALEISAAFDRVGGDVNAYTTKEYTCFHAKVLDEDLPMAAHTLVDMLTASVLEPAEVELERGVILEEIAAAEDEPADIVHDLFARALFGDAPLGRPILGSEDSIRGLSRSTVAAYWRRGYTPDRMVIAAAGNVDHAVLVRLLRGALGGMTATRPDSTPALLPAAKNPAAQTKLAAAQPVSILQRRTEQANLVFGVRGLPRRDGREWAMTVLTSALGGGMSSRLFQEIREKRGLAYSVYAFDAGYTDAGMFGISVGCQPRRTRQVLDILTSQLEDVAAHGLTPDELDLGKGQVRGALLLGQEDTHDRMSRLGKGELLFREVLDVPEMLRRLEQVDLDAVQALARDVLSRPRAVAAIGPFRDADTAAFERAVA